MRILLWAPFGAGTHYWGPGTSAYRLYKNNKDKNVKVTLVHGSKSQDIFSDVYDEQIRIGNIDNKSLFSYLVYLYKSYRWIKRIIKNMMLFMELRHIFICLYQLFYLLSIMFLFF